jgi:hypothetical protein
MPLIERLHSLRYRLFGRCWAEDCGRRMLLHPPSQSRRCVEEPIALTITEQGRAHALVAEAED